MIFSRVQFVVILTLISLAVAGQPTANFTSNVTTGCGTTIVNFTDLSSGGGITSWVWIFGDGTANSSQQNPTHAYTTAGCFTVTLIVTNSLGQKDTIIKPNYICTYPLPASNFTATPTAGCRPLQVAFSDLSTSAGGNIVQWTWIFGDASAPFSGQNPVKSYNDVGIYTVTLTVVDQNGCTHSQTKNAYISVDNPPVAAFSATFQESCEPPLIANFSNQSTGNGLTFQWDFGDGNTSTDTIPVHEYNEYGIYTVTLIVTNENACTDTIVKTHYVDFEAFANNVTVNNVEGCMPFTANFQATSPDAVSWQWVFGDNLGTSTSQNPSFVFDSAGTYSVSLISVSSLGCIDTIVLTNYITVHPLPTVEFTADTTTSCHAPFCVQFTNLSSASVWRQWTTDGNNYAVNNPNICYNSPGQYNVRLRIRDAKGCEKSLTKTAYIKIANPTAEFTATPRLGCAPLEVAFTDLSTSLFPIATWEWEFCEGPPSSLQNPTHIFNDTTPCWVSLAVCSDIGCCDTIVKNNYITAGLKPESGFYADETVGCHQFTVQFNDTSSYWADQWFWDFGDNGTSSQQHPEHIYEDLEFFDVTLVTGHHGCFDTLIKVEYIEVLPPKPDFSADPRVICEYESHTVQFTDESIQAETWLWTFGDGVGTSTDQNPTYTYSGPGFYAVKLVVTNANGCRDSIEYTNFIRISYIEPGFFQDTAVACVLNNVSFQDTSLSNTSIVAWNWNFGDGNTGTSNPASNFYLQDTTVDITLIVTDQLGCKDTISKERNLVVHSRPSPRFVADTTYGCKPFHVQFTDLSVPRDSATLTAWSWNFGDGNTSTEQNPAHVYQNRGNYTVTLTVTNSHGCDSTWVIANYIKPTFPYPSFTHPATICHYDSVRFQNTSTGGGLVYQWDFGDGTPGSTAISPWHKFFPDSTNIYTIQVMATDTNGCDSTLQRTIRVSRPIADFFADSVSSECPPFGAQFHNNSTLDAVQWNWNFGDPLSGSANTNTNENPFHMYYQSGKYDVRMVMTNTDGCRDTILKPEFININGPRGTFDFYPKAGCAPLTVTFVANAVNAAEYQWIFGDGNSVTTNFDSLTYTYYNGDIYIPVLVITDSLDGPLDSILCTVILVPDSNIKIISGAAYFAADTNLLCNSYIVNFSDSSSASIHNTVDAWSWNFGDGGTSTEQNPSHLYDSAGLFDVTLTVQIDSCFYSHTFNNYIRLSGLTGSFTIDTSITCTPPLEVNFHATAIDADNYIWDFGDGTYGNDSIVSHTYPPGWFDPILTIEDTIIYLNDTVVCVDVSTIPTTIKVIEADVLFEADTNLLCKPDTIHFTDLSVVSPGSTINVWDWDFGDSGTSGQQNPSYYYQTPGLYDVSLTITIESCEYSFSLDNYIRLSGLSGSFSFDPTFSCAPPLTVNFDANVTDADHYVWEFGDQQTGTGNPIIHTYDAGHYNPILIVYDSISYLNVNTVCTDTISHPITIKVLEGYVDFEADTTFACYPSTFFFNDSSAFNDTIATWHWEFGDANESNIQHPSNFYANPGYYTVTLTVTIDSCIYEKTKLQYIHIYDPPDLVYNLSDTAGCYPLEVRFDIVDSTLTDSVIAWHWSFGNNLTDSVFKPSTFYDTTNTYTIVLTATLWNNCVYQYPHTQNILVFPIPNADFVTDHNQYHSRRRVKFTNLSEPATSIATNVWDFGDGNASLEVNPEHDYDFIGDYEVMLIVSTAEGCLDTAFLTVTVLPRIDIPNAFTPNGDGINDIFLEGFELTILNRWGQVLYEGNDGWDGTYNGEKVPKGTYFFIVNLEEEENIFKKLHGSVTIVDN